MYVRVTALSRLFNAATAAFDYTIVCPIVSGCWQFTERLRICFNTVYAEALWRLNTLPET